MNQSRMQSVSRSACCTNTLLNSCIDFYAVFQPLRSTPWRERIRWNHHLTLSVRSAYGWLDKFSKGCDCVRVVLWSTMAIVKLLRLGMVPLLFATFTLMLPLTSCMHYMRKIFLVRDFVTLLTNNDLLYCFAVSHRKVICQLLGQLEIGTPVDDRTLFKLHLLLSHLQQVNTLSTGWFTCWWFRAAMSFKWSSIG